MSIDLNFAREVILSEARAVESMSKVIDNGFLPAAEMILNCKGTVIITGIGKAGLIGEKISATMASVGTPSYFLHPVEAIHGDLGRVREEDVVIALSNGGETAEVLRVMNLLKQREIRIISITGNSDSRLAKHSDVCLCMGKLEEACPLGIAPSVSTTCMLAIGDSLALAVMKARNFGPEDYARFHPGGSLGAQLITVGQSMEFRQSDNLPLADMDDTIAVTLEKTSHTKRRGAIMVTDSQGKLAGIITDADLRRLMVSRGADAMNAKACEVMTPGCKRVTEETLASEAMAIFHKFRIDDLPVVDRDDKPVGLIDVQDIVSIKIVG